MSEPISATTEAKKCNCSMRIQLVGDGCSICNPELWAEILSECATCAGRGVVASVGYIDMHPYPEAETCPECKGSGRCHPTNTPKPITQKE